MPDELPAIKNIIVPLDGSDLSETALPIVSALAAAADAHIDLVTVALTSEVPLKSQMDSLTQQALHRAEAALLAKHHKVGRKILAGVPADEISAYAATSNADLIVMATHGRSGFRRLILGSVADRLISQSHVPVMLVRASGDEPTGSSLADAKIEQIILPLDGRESTPAAVPFALVLAKLFGAGTILLYVDEGVDPEPGQRQLRAFAGVFGELGLNAETRSVDGEPGEAIADVASLTEHSMVVMSSLSATGVARGSHRGSVADYVVKNSEVPVLIVPPRGYLGAALE